MRPWPWGLCFLWHSQAFCRNPEELYVTGFSYQWIWSLLTAKSSTLFRSTKCWAVDAHLINTTHKAKRKKEGGGAGEMIQWIKYMLCKHVMLLVMLWRPKFDPQKACKSCVWLSTTVTPTLGRSKKTTGKFQWDLGSKTEVENRERKLNSTPGFHMWHKDKYICIYTCKHTHTLQREKEREHKVK